MIKSVTALNYLGEEITFRLTAPEETGFVITKITGLGPSNANINSTEIATRDGAFYNSSRIVSRNIVLYFKMLMNQTVEDVRLMSYRYFPVKQPLTLTIETDNRRCQIIGYVESNDPDIFSKSETTQISIICPDPFFYSTAIQTTMFSGVEPMFEFPFSNEHKTVPLLIMGEITDRKEQTIVYDGESEIGMIIRIHSLGTASNIRIYNILSREQIFIDTDKLEEIFGTAILKGDDVIIRTVKGSKSITLVRDGVGYNILNCLDKNSDWFRLLKGRNVFAYTAESGSENLQFTVQNQIAYEGV